MLTQAAITKGTPAQFTLNKTEMAALIPSGNYFADVTNWRQVVLQYQSTGSHIQNVTVRMDATLASPVGNFFISLRALDAFEVKTAIIYDFDGGKYTIKRNALPVEEFDVNLVPAGPELLFTRDFSQAPTGDEFTSGTITGGQLILAPSESYYTRTMTEISDWTDVVVRIWPVSMNFNDGFEQLQVNGEGNPHNVNQTMLQNAITGSTYVEVDISDTADGIFGLGALGWSGADQLIISKMEFVRL